MQQQHADYDLLAVFTDETKADTAAMKLRKEGFGDEEVHQLTSGSIGRGQFREHGPNSARSEYFLQTRRSGPNPLLVVLLAVIFAVVLGGLAFAASFAIPTVPEPTPLVVGAVIGVILGIIIGLLQRGRVRGAIGQNVAQPQPNAPSAAGIESRTIVALRFVNAENISRKSRARAILLNNQGKIDRSVGQRD